MARDLRIYFPGAWYHVMNRGVNRAIIFYNDDHKLKFLTLLHEIKEIHGVEIHAFCLMSNHYHLIIHTPRGNISDAIRYLNSKYATYVNQTMHRDGPLFKGRFKAILVSADDYLIKLSRYIHLNPLEAKMISQLSNYKWSSYPCYLEIDHAPDWLSTNEIINRFGSIDFARKYKIFVEETSDKELKEFYDNYTSQPILGDKDFHQTVDDYVRNHSLSAEIVGANNILVPPTMEAIVNAVAFHFKISSADILKKCGSKKNIPRHVAIYICRHSGGFPLNEISIFMSAPYKTISSTIQRVGTRVDLLEISSTVISALKLRAITMAERR